MRITIGQSRLRYRRIPVWYREQAYRIYVIENGGASRLNYPAVRCRTRSKRSAFGVVPAFDGHAFVFPNPSRPAAEV